LTRSFKNFKFKNGIYVWALNSIGELQQIGVSEIYGVSNLGAERLASSEVL